MLEIQVLSDLHLEKRSLPFTIEPHAPILALAGDIDSYPFNNLLSLLSDIAPKFDLIFYVLGNHEYHNNLDLPLHYIERFLYYSLLTFPNVHILQNTYFDLGDYIIAGSTLWSFVPPNKNNLFQDKIEDYKLVSIDDTSFLNPLSQNKLYYENVFNIENLILNFPSKKIIILTHHAPTFNSTQRPEFIDDELSHAFCSNLDHLLAPPIVGWIFGHTHSFTQTSFESTKLISNPLGNINENTGFKNNFIVKF